MRTLKTLFIFALAFTAFAQEQGQTTSTTAASTIYERIAAAEKEKQAAKAAFEEASAKYREAEQNLKIGDAPPPQPDRELERWISATNRLLDLEIEKVMIEVNKSMDNYHAKQKEYEARASEATERFCKSSAIALADPKISDQQRAPLANLRQVLCKE